MNQKLKAISNILQKFDQELKKMESVISQDYWAFYWDLFEWNLACWSVALVVEFTRSVVRIHQLLHTVMLGKLFSKSP